MAGGQTEDGIAQRAAHAIHDGSAQEEFLEVGRLTREDFLGQVFKH